MPKSWFKTSSQSKHPTAHTALQPPPESNNPTSAPNHAPFPLEIGRDRLRPIEFSPNRLQTLYVTPSDRNLYLAAMSQLDQSPPPLPLWSEGPPTLPKIVPQHTVPAPAVRPDALGREASDEWFSITPFSPKMVTSPEVAAGAGTGLSIREEFRKTSPPLDTKFAFLALTGSASLRFTEFPSDVLTAVNGVIQKSWSAGLRDREVPGRTVLSNAIDSANLVWKVKLEGHAWKRHGDEELDPIRLLLAIFGVLAQFGWTCQQKIHGGGPKADVHNLLFRQSGQADHQPPVFFAITMPLPDRIALISPPKKSTPALISSVRQAILSAATARVSHLRLRTATETAGTKTSKPKGEIKWAEKKGKIKVEGWVNDGVYRFWLDGMRRWPSGNVKKTTVQVLQPRILLNIISSLSSMHFNLVTSIPLLPITAGRDVLIFAASPETGLSIADAFEPKQPPQQVTGGTPNTALATTATSAPRLPPRAPQQSDTRASSGTESPVLVSRTNSLRMTANGGKNPRDVDPERRVLPWTSVRESDQPTGPMLPDPTPSGPTAAERRASFDSSQDSNKLVPPAAAGVGRQWNRRASQESARPLMQGTGNTSSAQSSPRSRNVLLKKNSLRKRTSSANNSVMTRSRQVSDSEDAQNASAPPHVGHADENSTARAPGPQILPIPVHTFQEEMTPPDVPRPDQATRNSERWSLVDAPANIGHPGMTRYEPEDRVSPQMQPPPPSLPARPEPQEMDRFYPSHGIRPSLDGQSFASAATIRLPAGIALGQPLRQFPNDDPAKVDKPHDHLAASPYALPTSGTEETAIHPRSPRSPHRAQVQDVDIGMNSVHGSVGYIHSMISIEPHRAGMEMGEISPLPLGGHVRALSTSKTAGGGGTGFHLQAHDVAPKGKGKGKEKEIRRSSSGESASGVGSARTKVSMAPAEG